MKPVDFLEVAGEWAAGTREAEWRSAVSRAYYAAFHAAGDLLRQCRFRIPAAEQAHAYIWLRLANAGEPNVISAGNRLKDLRTYRNRADYDLGQPFAQTVAVSQVSRAEAIVKLLEPISATPATLARITATIQVYERDVLKQVTWNP